MTRKKSSSTRQQEVLSSEIASTNGNGETRFAEFTLYRRWLYSLTRDELLRAMEFEFIPSDNAIGSSSGSYDYDLLVEMMQLQSPPPTPVHPRALGYRPRASQHGPQLDHEEIKQRAQPRMFQWEERQSRSPVHLSTGRTTRNNINRRLQPRFDVVARKKQTSWGQVLSMGRTSEQREADDLIVSGTRLSALPANSGTGECRRFAMFVTPAETNHDNNYRHQHPQRQQLLASKLNTTKSILRMLRVASRGYFLQRNVEPTTVTGSFQSSQRIPYCSPWLNPTERWFSLSFYLASRYQAALWTSYCSQHKTIPTLLPPQPSNKILSVAMPKAMCAALKEVLLEDQQSSGSHGKLLLRDSKTWEVLVSDLEGRNSKTDILLNARIEKHHPQNDKIDWELLWRIWLTTPLTQVTSTKHQLRVILLSHLELAIASEVERALLESSIFDEGPQGNSSGKKKKSKRKRAKQQQQKVTASLPSDCVSSGVEEEVPIAVNDESTSSSLEAPVTAVASENNDVTDSTGVLRPSSCISKTDFSFPTRAISVQERNRNVIIVLTILDDVLESAFAHAGLGPTPTFDEESPKERNRLSKPIPAPSSLPWNQDTSKQQTSNHNGQNVQARGGRRKKRKGNQQRQNQRHKEDGKETTQRRAFSSTSQPTILEEEGYHRESRSHSESSSLGGGSGHSASHAFDEDWNNGPWEPVSDSKTPWPLAASNGGGSSDDSIVAVGGHWSQQGDPPELLPNYNYDSRVYHHRNFHAFAGANESPFFDATDSRVADGANDSRGLDEWPFLTSRYQPAREHSILSEFFRTQEERIDEERELMAASTAASIASSTYKDVPTVTEVDEVDKINDVQFRQSPTNGMNAIVEDDHMDVHSGNIKEKTADDHFQHGNIHETGLEKLSPQLDPRTTESIPASLSNGDHKDSGNMASSNSSLEPARNESPPPSPSSSLACRSPSPEAPLTPPPTLSPILLSLADLRHLKTSTPERLGHSGEPKTTRSAAVSGSLPSSPVPKNGLTPSWSREDLRITAFRDDQIIRQRGLQFGPAKHSVELPLLRPAPIKSLAKPIASSKGANFDYRMPTFDSAGRREDRGDSCAQSETAVEGHDDDQQWPNDIQKTQSPQGHEEADNVTKDESTTITSAMSNREHEEISSIREERNTFRDMCLTLGAEVAKLKAMLAAQKATAIIPPMDYPDGMSHAMYVPGSFDPTGMAPFFHGIQRGKRLGPMSDAGLHRPGDHESQVSEDDNYEMMSRSRVENPRRLSSSATVAGSDASVEFNNSNSALLGGPVGVMPVHDSVSVQGLQSRLTKDIMTFLSATTSLLRKQDAKRGMAIERFTRLVISLWPRAQVKLYGSHVSGLCLPSSDLDFVICLPAVHKNAPALAPGVLEGRNAINETSQKLLARQLKGESWIDPRSIKLIERTVVPVIKVCTKDTRARMIALDISFDSNEHHGLVAIEMVAQIMDELPLIRPLVLVLKQFLLDRGLLTSYTGGLSSYCLFLMAARYLQDQPSKIGDCGSLLMGFLDFYGNCFDPRTTGISVRRRQYFARPNYAAAHHQVPGAQPMWGASHPQRVPSTPPQVVVATGHPDFRRRNSENAMSSDGTVRARPPRFQPGGATSHRYVPHHNMPHPQTEQQHNGRPIRPFTFDPLFVEDPLAAGNNVGRNAFRINQVQRAFSDAHRALVASLEWDINTSGEFNDGVDYPLLKCLLRGEDVVYEL